VSAQVAPLRIRAAVLDWAGTTVDHGSRAPVEALLAVFADHGVQLSEADARGPMGIAKREHIRLLLEAPAIADAWRAATGDRPAAEDIEVLFGAFTRILPGAIVACGDIIPGVPEAIATLRAQGVAIGSTTGYSRSAAEAAAAIAADQGYAPDVLVAVDEVPAGRPEPWMLLRAMEALRVFPPAAVVKVGDTAVDMAEGRNAGTWAVGVTETGNELGRSLAQLERLPVEERTASAHEAGERLLAAGAHLVIRSVADLPMAVQALDGWLAAGQRP
jgi:phosphonoacetaldehyde hydrolase